MLEGDSLCRSRRFYYAYIGNAISGSTGQHHHHQHQNNNNNTSSSDVEHSFGRPMVLVRLGQFIMDVKVIIICNIISLCL